MRASHLRAPLALFTILALLLATTPRAYADDLLDDGVTNATDDETPANWFVELTTPSTSEGATVADTVASQVDFRTKANGKGVSYTERYAYSDLWNGFSITATSSEVAKLQGLTSVKTIWPVATLSLAEPVGGGEQIDLATAITMTGADYVQNTLGITGKNIKVAVIDTGIDYQNPDLGGCFGPSCRVFTGFDFVGDAYDAGGTGDATVPHPDPDPEDCNGHGTHVSGIVGAKGAVIGVAPDVRFGAYRVFGCNGSTSADVMLAAMERALTDHMDVINMSIGSSFQWPQYPTAVGADRLVTKHGIVVVASIGNSGASGLYSSSAPGVGENVIGVASFDNIKILLPYFTSSPSGTQIGYIQASGSPAAPTFGTATLARTGAPTSAADACAALPAGSLAGKVAVIRRGGCSFNQKSFNAQNAGATGVILYNNTLGFVNATVAGPPNITIPVVGTSDALGVFLNDEIVAGHTTITWTADMARIPNSTGNLISSFSSYGLAPDLSLKPDIGAPGGFIYSTLPLAQGGHGVLSGTSMSSPHVAGAVALLLQANPKNLRELGAASVRGLLQNTAVPHPWFGNPSLGLLDNVHRQGAGMLDIRAAIEANTYATPSKLALGETQASPFTRTITITSKPGTGKTVSYTFSHQAALATTNNTFAPGFSTSAATVSFSTAGVSVKNNQSASVVVTITPPTTPALGLYGGYILASGDDGSTLRVPYSGFVGDYQALVVLTNVGGPFGANAGRVCRATATPGSFAIQPFGPPGGSFTFTSATQTPFFCQHFNHQSRTATFNARNTATNVTYPALSLNFLPRNSSATGFFAIGWDGASGTGDARTNVPNGTYEITIDVLKALGDPAAPAHTEHRSLGFLTIARP